MSTESKTRPYRKRARAEAEQRTRRRIAQAAVELHGSVGPARTTMSAVAERAGVQRTTLYRHFPDEAALFGACTALWDESHPGPDIEAWARISDPDERLRRGLADLYAFYEDGEAMLANVIRDAPLVEAVAPHVAGLLAFLDAAAETLLRGRPERGRRRDRVAAALGHAVSFFTWRSLTRPQGLDSAEAIAVMEAAVAAAADAG